MQKLDNLVTKGHHHLNKYNVEFNEYSTLTGFDECALQGPRALPQGRLGLHWTPHHAQSVTERVQELD